MTTTPKLKPIRKRISKVIEESKETHSDLILLEAIRELSNICDGMYVRITQLEKEIKEMNHESRDKV